MALPAIVADSVAAGLFGGPCWANTAVAATRRPAQTKRLFMAMFLLRAELGLWTNCLDAKIVAPYAHVREAEARNGVFSARSQSGGRCDILLYATENRRFHDAFKRNVEVCGGWRPGPDNDGDACTDDGAGNGYGAEAGGYGEAASRQRVL